MNDTQQNNRTWSDAFGLVLFGVGALASSLLVLAMVQDPMTGQASTKTAAMGHARLGAGGAGPASVMSLACLLLGAAQFLGHQGALRVTRHLVGVLGVVVGLSIVLGAFSGFAGGRFGVVVGGGLADLASAPLATLVGLGVISCAVWAVWMTPTRAEAWERAQEIEKPAVSLQAKADGVTSEESAALALDGGSDTYSETVESPYPEDVRVHGQIPDGAAALVAEETTNHVETEEEPGSEDRGERSPVGPEGAAEAAQESGAVPLEADVRDERTAGEDLAFDDDATATELDSATGHGSEDELTPGQDFEEAEPAESFEVDGEEPLEGEELEDTADEVSEGEDVEGEEEDWEEDEELEGEDVEYEEEELEEDDAAGYEEDEGEPLEEDDSENEEEEVEGGLEDEAEAEAEAEDEIEEEAAGDYEEAAQLEDGEAAEDLESSDVSEEQGDLFDMEGDGATESEVILEPQARPAEETEEILMKAADLFLDRDRVAVSLLQRQFQLDFEESCAVLDELQERGLIGPYLGGNRRDILLTREEWLERVEGAT